MKKLMLTALASLFIQSAHALDVVTCNQGALVVSTTSKANVFNISIKDRGVANFIVGRIHQNQSPDNSGVVINRDGTLTIPNMSLSYDGDYVTNQYGPHLDLDNRGGKLFINYFKMTGSHSYDFYGIAPDDNPFHPYARRSN